MIVCKYWKEIDREDGYPYEHCKLEHKKCSCCGTESQCNFKWALEDKQSEERYKIHCKPYDD